MIHRMVAARLLVVGSIVLVAGCGASAPRRAHRPAPARAPLRTGTPTIPSPSPTGVAPDPGAVSVIRGWADALRRGDVVAAARYFALPSEMINGVVIRIHSVAQAAYANATLPCGARFISAEMRGRYVTALFRLTGRPGAGGSDCGGGAGQTARTNFVIADGRIVEWIRAPDDPGDNRGAPSAPPVPNPNPGPVA
jgi:hypothetical protein